MTHEEAAIDPSMQLWSPDLFPEYLSFLDDSTVESLEINNKQSPDTEQNTQDSPPGADAAEPALKARKRGRPRVLDDDGSDAATKERRKIQLRIAQRAYRSRKEERIATLSKKVTELEQKVLIYRALYLGTRSAVAGSGFPIEWATQADLMAGIEAQTLAPSVGMQSAAFMPDPEAAAMRARNNNALAQHMASTYAMSTPHDPSYMMDDGGCYGNWVQASDGSGFPFT
ncbi:hypothetical protein BJX64DRAFT_284087 [Aspergillus heterothallicus]